MSVNNVKLTNKFLGELAFKIEKKTSSKVNLSKLIEIVNDSDVWIYESLEQLYDTELFDNYMREDLIDEFVKQLKIPITGTFKDALVGDLIFESQDNHYIVGGNYIQFFNNSLESVLID